MKKMRKRRLTLMLTGLFLIVLLAGCTQNPTQDPTPSEGPTPTAELSASSAQEITLTYSCWDQNQARLLRTVADEFEAKNQGIKIDIQVNGWVDYWTALEAAATGGTLPDTFWMHSNNIYYYGANDQLLDLTAYIQADPDIDLSSYPQGLNQIYNINGKQYAIPKDYDTIALWYNKKLFDEAGISYPDDTWTWDDLYEAARKLTKADKSQYGFCAGLHNQEGYYNFVYQNGGEIVTAGRKSGYDQEKTIGGIEAYFKLVQEGLSPEIYDDQARAEAMQNGLTAMGLFGSWNLSGFAESELMVNNFDCAVLPMSNSGGKSSIFNGLGNAIAANCQHPDEAWTWIKYLSTKEGQLRQAELGIAISAFNGTADAWTKAYPMFNAKCYIEMVDYAQIRPYTNQTSIWEDKAYELLKGAYAGKEDVGTACGKIAQMMNEAIAAE